MATTALLVLTLGGILTTFGVPRSLRAGNLPRPGPAKDLPSLTSPVAFVWQTEGDPDLPLNDPSQMAVDADGNLWVADGRNNRFQVFAPDGTFREAWGTAGSAEGQFDLYDPAIAGGYGSGAIAFDTAGNLFVLDSGNRRIQKFDPDRAFVTAWGSLGDGDGQFLTPIDLAVDRQGHVYVTDYRRAAVQVFAGDGRFLAAWDRETVGVDQFDPTGITIDADGNVWVTEYGPHRIWKLSSAGVVLAAWGTAGSGLGELNTPWDVAVDEAGQVYLTDYFNYRVQVFDGDGRFLAGWGALGRDAGEFVGPTGIALDGTGLVYVSEDSGDRVQAFRLLPPLAGVAAASSADR